jgi:sugar lactone lactonase YvrE
MIKRFVCTAMVTLSLWPGLATAEANEKTARLIELYQSAMTAVGEGDFETYGKNMQAALALAPGHPAVMRHLARALARQGRGDEAIAWLRKVAASGADLVSADDEHFASIKDRDDFKAVLDVQSLNQEPAGDVEEAFRLPAADFLPEGIAYDPEEDVFYLGSIRQGKVVSVSRTGRMEDLVAPDDAGGVLGLRVDAARRQLWGVTVQMPGYEGFREERAGNTSVFRVDLDGGVVDGRWDLSNADGAHGFNDVVVTSDGRAYITDTDTGSLYTIAPDGGGLEVFMGAQTARGANGIALSADEQLMYVAQYGIDIVVVDLERKTADPIAYPEDVVVCGIDGLYLHEGSLVAVQNYLGMQQVTQFVLGGEGRSVVTARVLARQDPRFEDPTTGAFAGGEFFVIANSQLPRIGADGVVPPADAFDDTFILKITVD